MIGKTWTKPKYTVKKTLPFIPTETEVDNLIAGCNIEEASLLQLAKETALRKGEALGGSWDDIDLETRTIRISPEKGSNPRITKLSYRCLNMLLEAKRKHGTNKLYAKTAKTFDRNLQRARAKTAYTLQNDRIRKITFHTLRHWKATMLYHQTKDIVYVQQFLGHKTINHTLKYIQLAEALFHDVSNFTVRTAKTHEEAKSLLEAGFQKADEFDGIHLYRKPK
jgi:integrase